MSYYSILPSNRVGSGTTFSNQNPDPMRPLQRPDGGFRTRDVNENELSSNQLNSLLDQNSAYIQRARNSGLAQANSRGLLNSSMAAGAAQGAAIDAAMPMAMQQAGAYTNVGDRNMDAENQYLLQRDALGNAMNIANMNSGTSLEIARMNQLENQRQFDENTRRYDQEYATDQERYNTDWQRQLDLQDRTNMLNRNNFIQSGIFNNIMSNPELWRDPEGSMGFANYYTQNFANLWDSLFPRGGYP